MGQVNKSPFQSARIVVDLVTTRQHAHPEEGLSTPRRQPSAKARARTAKAKDGKTNAKEAPSGAKDNGEKKKAKFLHLRMLNGSGLKAAHRMHSGHRA